MMSENGDSIEIVKHTRMMTNVREPATYKAMVVTMMTGGEVKVVVESIKLHFTKDGDVDPREGSQE